MTQFNIKIFNCHIYPESNFLLLYNGNCLGEGVVYQVCLGQRVFKQLTALFAKVGYKKEMEHSCRTMTSSIANVIKFKAMSRSQGLIKFNNYLSLVDLEIFLTQMTVEKLIPWCECYLCRCYREERRRETETCAMRIRDRRQLNCMQTNWSNWTINLSAVTNYPRQITLIIRYILNYVI